MQKGTCMFRAKGVMGTDVWVCVGGDASVCGLHDNETTLPVFSHVYTIEFS